MPKAIPNADTLITREVIFTEDVEKILARSHDLTYRRDSCRRVKTRIMRHLPPTPGDSRPPNHHPVNLKTTKRDPEPAAPRDSKVPPTSAVGRWHDNDGTIMPPVLPTI